LANETLQSDTDQPNDDFSPTPNKDVFDKQLKARTRSRFWRSVGTFALATTVGSLAFALGYFNLTPQGRETKQDLQSYWHTYTTVKENPDLIFDKANSDHVNILLIGRDVDYKEIFSKSGRNLWHTADKHTRARSDSMIVMALDKTQNTIRMVSFPRDAIVHLPPNEFHVRKGKLNAAHAYGGPELLKQTIHDELGVTIDHYAVIKFDGFKKLIDDIGGIWVNVDGALKRKNGKLYRGNLDYDDNWGNLHIHLKPGLQLLDGQKAHDFVRFRMDLEGDPGRMRRQQMVMRALAKQLAQMPKWRLPGMIKEIRRQFETDMNDTTIASAAYFAKRIGDPTKIQPLTLFGVYSTRGSLTLNRPKNKKLLAYIFGPKFNSQDFLAHSPSTTEDELGPTNNSSPGAKQILREAGVIKDSDDKTLAESPEVKAPVKEEDTTDVVAAAESSNHRKHTRLAVADEDNNDASHARRHRRSHHRTDDVKRPRHSRDASDEGSSSRSESSRSAAESPVPVPESSSSSSDSSSNQ